MLVLHNSWSKTHNQCFFTCEKYNSPPRMIIPLVDVKLIFQIVLNGHDLSQNMNLPQYFLAGTSFFTCTQQYRGKGTTALSIFCCCSLSNGISSRCDEKRKGKSITEQIVNLCHQKEFEKFFLHILDDYCYIFLYPSSPCNRLPRVCRKFSLVLSHSA